MSNVIITPIPAINGYLSKSMISGHHNFALISGSVLAMIWSQVATVTPSLTLFIVPLRFAGTGISKL